ncbi:MAG: cell division ATP-binding protein FtsE [Firmicutes bacterium]|nr:cell division ATP-binding protein FtsE [Bacillota bacterium]
MSVIEFTDVALSYAKGNQALAGVNVLIEKGEFVFLVGSTGSGKSSFLKLIYRDELPSSGEVYINNNDITTLSKSKVPYLRRNIGVIFQDFKLLDYKTVFENIAYALEVTGCPSPEIPQKVEDVLSIVGLSEKKDRLPEELSGGEKQLTSIARALVHNPSILLADEPTGNLDPDSTWNIMRILDFINSKGTTVIMATHDMNIVNKMKKRVIVIEGGKVASDEGPSMEIPELKD